MYFAAITDLNLALRPGTHRCYGIRDFAPTPRSPLLAFLSLRLLLNEVFRGRRIVASVGQSGPKFGRREKPGWRRTVQGRNLRRQDTQAMITRNLGIYKLAWRRVGKHR